MTYCGKKVSILSSYHHEHTCTHTYLCEGLLFWDFAFPVGLVVYSIERVLVRKFGNSFILPPSLSLLSQDGI